MGFHGGIGAAIIFGGQIVGGTITGATITGGTITGATLETDVPPNPRIVISGTDISYYTGNASEITPGQQTMSVVTVPISPAGQVFYSSPDMGQGAASMFMQSATADGFSDVSRIAFDAHTVTMPSLTADTVAGITTVGNVLFQGGGSTVHSTIPVTSDGLITGTAKLLLASNGAAGGAHIELRDTSGGGTSKFLRSAVGQFQVINNAYTTTILALSDTGTLDVPALLISGVNFFDAWTNYTPVVTNLGTTSTPTGRFKRIGKTITGFCQVAVTGAPAGAVAVTVTLPSTTRNTAGATQLGTAHYRTNAGAHTVGVWEIGPNVNAFSVLICTPGAANPNLARWTGGAPAGQANGDNWFFAFTYEEA